MTEIEEFVNEVEEQGEDLSNVILSDPCMKLTEDGKVIGIISFTCVEDEVYLLGLAVHPNYQNKGNGEELVDNLVNLFEEVKIESDIYGNEYFVKLGFSVEDNILIKRK